MSKEKRGVFIPDGVDVNKLSDKELIKRVLDGEFGEVAEYELSDIVTHIPEDFSEQEVAKKLREALLIGKPLVLFTSYDGPIGWDEDMDYKMYDIFIPS